ncbi:hypothetical protein HBH70_092020 [Parastagonospora nodorum]|nr:hypothetical protein HBH53_060940 [Parastagonospora nodorum]KAH3999021.1 hypothetical protein HBI10_119490 [Parastagonospora nodorum]KAH4025123.1 hypothetical protein HBI13_077700 [Parastagonospora nodorum]KAH4067756.1 hypothetical protein HBH50_131330 [Parastagonospora nodorum]KAH4081287.1 hypothetical protein HBH46_227430 [Parastagonospora nodorum]
MAATTTDSGAKPKRVWTTLITNTDYLTGLLTLDYSLKKHGTKYPLIALYTDTFPTEGHAALDARSIPKQHVKYLLPSVSKDYSNDPRFYDCWSKLTPFGLTEYDRVVQLDSDMLVLRNMDDLMDLPLDSPELAGKGERVFAASHACVCNPLNKAHYPKDWVPSNCGFTSQHDDPENAQITGAPSDFGLGMPNGGLQVVNPSAAVYDLILARLSDPTVMAYDFADQSLLGDLFRGRWVPLPYTYNALKTLRTFSHKVLWRDEEVRNVHYILSPKPWQEKEGERSDEETHGWWWKVNAERLVEEKKAGIQDEF